MYPYDVFVWPDGSWMYRRYYSVEKHAYLGDYNVICSRSDSRKCSIFILAFRDKKIT